MSADDFEDSALSQCEGRDGSRERRHPSAGWINPKLNDLIIIDARDGFNIEAICLRRRCDKHHVMQLLRSAVEFDFITTKEANSLHLYSEEVAA